MAELQFNAVNRLGLHTEGLLTLCHFDILNFRNVDKMLTKMMTYFSVSYFKDVNGKKISNFDEVPVFKDPTEMSLNVLEVHYKFSKFQQF